MNIGRYQVDGELGRGGLGVVYSAVDPGLERALAIKGLLDPKADTAELIREGRVLAGLSHPNIVSVLDAFICEGRLMIVMEKVAGGTLGKWMLDDPAPGLLERVLILEQMADALGHAHKAKVQHRDLTPRNVMVTPGGVAKVLDFGLAKRRDVAGGAGDPTSALRGTRSYMAPEQLTLGISGFASDVFAFGVVAYELLSGRHPFPGNTELLVQNAIVNLPAPPLASAVSELPSEAIRVIEKCLAKKPDQRYANLTEVELELRCAVFPMRQAEARRLALEGLATLERGDRLQAEYRLQAEHQAEGAEKLDRGCPELAKLQGRLEAGPVEVPLPAVISVRPQPEQRAWRDSKEKVYQPPAVTIAPLEVRTNLKDGLRYVRIPSGTFQMGCSPGDGECHPNEKPAHEVRISEAFWMGQTAVTVEAYKRYAAANGKAMPSLRFGGDSLPMTEIDWTEAKSYCEWAGMRLPTEAEWEYAARAGTTEARYGAPLDIAWYEANSGGRPNPVGTKAPNAFKLHDMLGNVREWTADWYSDSHAGSGPVTDPTGHSTGQYRVLRGGSWGNNASDVRASYRNFYRPAYRSNNVGFRCTGELPVP